MVDIKYIYIVLTSLVLGFMVGNITGIQIGSIYEYALYVLIFFIGIDIGLGRLNDLKKVGKISIKLPLITLMGAFIGGLVGSFLLHISPKWALAVTMGCGWYSLAGPLIAQYSAFYGTIGFLSNLIREIIMVVSYPVTSKRYSSTLLISVGGATTMDTTLGIIKKFGSEEDVLIAFVHGFIVTTAVMFILPLILQF